jgi:glutamyl-Q tRNA(Asp) synthetase
VTAAPALGLAAAPAGTYRGRFAPSPTGPLHFGSLVAALASYCDARHDGGEWLVRIEDVDEPRSRSGAEAAILMALERYGFEWDGAIVRQSERTALYAEALGRLVAAGDAFECVCTRKELEGAPISPAGERVYPGTCRDGIAPDRARRTQRAWRVRVGADPRETKISYVDRLTGQQMQQVERDVGDFVVRRADGLYAYQLAVVVDDAAQGVTAVVRGADLAASTPRQIFLQRRLGLPTPSYLHVPVAVNAVGMKLSKQTRAAPLPPIALPVLLAAWRFLDQPLPAGSDLPANVAEFWSHAIPAWTPSRLPPVAMLPVRAAFGPRPTAPV